MSFVIILLNTSCCSKLCISRSHSNYNYNHTEEKEEVDGYKALVCLICFITSSATVMERSQHRKVKRRRHDYCLIKDEFESNGTHTA